VVVETSITDDPAEVLTECGNGYYIRLATLSDLSMIREIEIVAGSRFIGTGLLDKFFNDSGDQKITTFDQTRLCALVEKQQVWVVCHHAEPVGFAICAIFGKAAFLEEIDVLPAHGRRGLATKLIEHACRWAANNGLECMDLCTFESVPWNGPFYKKLGFVILSPEEWSSEILAEREMEKVAGLPMETRIVMRLHLVPSEG